MTEQAARSSEYGGAPNESSGRWQTRRLLADGIQLLVVGILLEYLLFNGTAIRITLRLIAIVLLLVGVMRSSGWLLLVALQASLFLREPGDAQMTYGISSFLFCLVALALVVYAHSGSNTRRRLSHWFALQVSVLSGRGPSRRNWGEHQSFHWWKLDVTKAVPAFSLAAIVLIAALLLIRLPITPHARWEWFQYSAAHEATLWPGANVIVVLLLLVLILREAAWRQMTPAQSRLYLRCTFMLEHHWDLRMIVLRGLRRKKRAGATQPTNVMSNPALTVAPAARSLTEN